MADDEITVEIEKETPTPEKTDGASADPVADLKAQYEELQAREETERKGREAAQRETAVERQARLAAEKQVETLGTEVAETRLGTVESGLSAAQTESEAAKAEYIAAQEAGDWKKAADAQQKLAKAEAKIVRLDEAKADLETVKIAKPEARQETQRPTDTDPLETFINSRTSATQKWLRDHPDEAKALALGTNSRKAAKLNAAHSDAIAEGIEPDTVAYFEHVEKFLGMTKDGKPNGAANGKTAVRKTSAPVAPVNATAGGTSGGGDVVKLSKNEAAAATDGTLTWNWDDKNGKFKKGDPIGVEEFARRKLAMQKEGRYDPMNFIQQ